MPISPLPAAAEARRPSHPPGAPWWRFAMVWFVLAGPAVVVVAGFATMAIAYRNADVVLSQPPPAVAAARPGPVSTTPALQARNHAATPSP